MNVSVPQNIRTVMQILDEDGFRPYLVGGCVRDTVMGKLPHDYDITVGALPEEITKCFESKGFRTIPKGREFGTVGILSEGEVVEVTPYRTEGTYSDSRHPDSVEFVSDISLDLSRRDFTINAMAMGIDGDIIDLFGGKEDLKRGIIRCVGNARERFSEDALRILRAIRFAARFGFDIEEETGKAMNECSEGLCKVSGERICSELRETLCAEHSFKVLSKHFNVIKSVIPCFTPHERLHDSYGDFAYKLYICILNGGIEAIEKVRSHLKLSNSEYERLRQLDKADRFDYTRTEDGRIIFDEKVKLALCSLSENAVRDIFILTASETSELDDFLKSGVYRYEDLAVTGGDIVKLGKFNVRETAAVLFKILKMVAVGEISNDYDCIMEFLKKCNTEFYKAE